MTLGERIQQLRRSAGLSQEQLGDLLGVSRQAVSKWETDQSEPELSKLAQLCRTFSVTSDELLGLETSPKPESSGGDSGGGVERLVRANRGRRLFTVGWITAVVGAVLLAVELICLYPIREAVIAAAIARGSGYYPDLWYYAASFPMSAVFALTGVTIAAGLVLAAWGLKKST